MRLNVVVKGLAAVTSAFQSREGNISAEIATALNQVGQEVFAESQRRVPVDTGNLKSSARIRPAVGALLEAEIAYGGTAAAYALVVHETPPSGGSSPRKYLEAPAREAAERLNQAVKQGVRRGGGM